MLPRPVTAESCRLVAGFDPRPRDVHTGYAILQRRSPGYWILRSHGLEPVYQAVWRVREACMVAVDAPLSPPYRGYRRVERRAMKELRARLLPGGFRGMSMLSLLGFSILQLFSEAGRLVVETHPRTVATITGINHKLLKDTYGRDIADSILAAITAASIAEGSYRALRDADGVLYFPCTRAVARLRYRVGLEVGFSKGH